MNSHIIAFFRTITVVLGAAVRIEVSKLVDKYRGLVYFVHFPELIADPYFSGVLSP